MLLVVIRGLGSSALAGICNVSLASIKPKRMVRVYPAFQGERIRYASAEKSLPFSVKHAASVGAPSAEGIGSRLLLFAR